MSYEEEISKAVTVALEALLANKHLYQAVKLPFDPVQLQKELVTQTSPVEVRAGAHETLRLLRAKWVVAWSVEDQKNAWNAREVCFQLPRIKIFCAGCDQISPYAPVTPPPEDKQRNVSGATLARSQVFFLPYECQGCVGESEPIFFMVTRRGIKLHLSGRSEIEVVSVPNFIPKETRDFYRRARHAYNCGEALAGLFLLRTFIEQHMRKAIGDPEGRLTGDELGQKYADLFDEGFKKISPSLKVQYAILSEALHKANDSAQFEEIERQILAHFEFKAVYERTKAIGGKKRAASPADPNSGEKP